MKTLSGDLQAHYQGGTTKIATCWKATLTNGTVVTATDHDQNIQFPPTTGPVYISTAGYSTSDMESSMELNPDNLEVQGFLRSPAITAADVKSGKWDYAAIEIFEVNWSDLTMGRNILRSGTLGEVKSGLNTFTAELRGIFQAYSRVIVRLVTKECTADFGDARCKKDLGPLTVSGSVWGLSDNRIIVDATRSDADDLFTAGKLTFTSGLNNGLSMEIKRNYSGDTIELVEPMPFAISFSGINVLLRDTFTMYQGCTKREQEDCKDKHNNIVNFRGYARLPGSAIYKVGGGA